MCLALSWAPFLPYFLAHSVSPVSFPHRSGQPMAPSRPASLAHEGPPGPSPAPRFGCGPLQGSHPHLATGHRPPGPSPATVHPAPARSTHCPPQTCSGPRPPGARKPPDPKDKQTDGDGVGSSFGGAVGARLLAVVKGSGELSCETVNREEQRRGTVQ